MVSSAAILATLAAVWQSSVLVLMVAALVAITAQTRRPR